MVVWDLSGNEGPAVVPEGLLHVAGICWGRMMKNEGDDDDGGDDDGDDEDDVFSEYFLRLRLRLSLSLEDRKQAN